jgi:hypothetical protein
VLTAGAAPPERHLGLVDREAVALRRLKASGLADRAVDVDRDATRATDEVVMVVADARLVAHRASGRRDPARQTGAVQRLVVTG